MMRMKSAHEAKISFLDESGSVHLVSGTAVPTRNVEGDRGTFRVICLLGRSPCRETAVSPRLVWYSVQSSLYVLASSIAELANPSHAIFARSVPLPPMEFASFEAIWYFYGRTTTASYRVLPDALGDPDEQRQVQIAPIIRRLAIGAARRVGAVQRRRMGMRDKIEPLQKTLAHYRDAGLRHAAAWRPNSEICYR
jgi:hypothetical protein